MKAYTDCEQSKKLAEILPLESADMYYQYVLPKSDRVKHNLEIGNPISALEWYNKGYTMSGKEPITIDEYCVPCWSLAALLNVIPKELEIEGQRYAPCLFPVQNKWLLRLWYNANYTITSPIAIFGDNPIDVYYEMILKLLKNVTVKDLEFEQEPKSI